MKESSRFVRVIVNCTKDTEEKKALRAKYEVRGYPTVVLLSPDGVMIERMTGARPAASVLEILRRGRGQAERGSFVRWRWRTDLTSSITEACRSGRPLLVWFSHVTCSDNLEDEFADERVAKASERFICLKVEVDCSTQVVRVCRQFKVEVFPAVLLLAPHGKEAERLTGKNHEVEAILEKMDEVADAAKPAKEKR